MSKTNDCGCSSGGLQLALKIGLDKYGLLHSQDQLAGLAGP